MSKTNSCLFFLIANIFFKMLISSAVITLIKMQKDSQHIEISYVKDNTTLSTFKEEKNNCSTSWNVIHHQEGTGRTSSGHFIEQHS